MKSLVNPKKLPPLYWQYRNGSVKLLLKQRIGLAMLLWWQKETERDGCINV